MMMARRLVLLVLAVMTFSAIWVGLQFLLGLADWGPPLLSHGVLTLYVLALLGVPVAATWLVLQAVARRWKHVIGAPSKRPPRVLLWAVMVGYALTAIVGIPAAQSRRDAWAVKEYKQIRASGSKRVWEAHPYIRTYVTIPILPCVILSYHEYQLDGLYGLGSFELAVWYGVGVRAAEVWPLWIS